MEKLNLSKKKLLCLGIGAGLLVIATIVLVLVLHSSNQEMMARNIRVNEVQGEVTVIREEMDTVAAYADMNLISGDAIITNEDARAILRLDEDKYIVLAENTKICLHAQGDSENSKTMIELSYGEVLSDIRSKLSDTSTYEVDTPSATMSVRGTLFIVEVESSAGEDESNEIQNPMFQKGELSKARREKMYREYETNLRLIETNTVINGTIEAALKDGSGSKLVSKLEQVHIEALIDDSRAGDNTIYRFVGGIEKVDRNSISNSTLQYLKDKLEEPGLDAKTREELKALLDEAGSYEMEESTKIPIDYVSEPFVGGSPNDKSKEEKAKEEKAKVPSLKPAPSSGIMIPPVLQPTPPLSDTNRGNIPSDLGGGNPSPTDPEEGNPDPIDPDPTDPDPTDPDPTDPDPVEYVDFSLWQPALVKAVYATLGKAEGTKIKKTEINQMTQINFSAVSGPISKECFNETTQYLTNVTKLILDGKTSSDVDHFPATLSTSKINSLSWRNAGLSDDDIDSNSITNLQQLEALDLSGNQFHKLGGSADVDSNTGDSWKFNSLTKLTKLNLANNSSLTSFGGLVPENTFTELNVSGTLLTWSIGDVRNLMKGGGNLTDHSITLKEEAIYNHIRDNGRLVDGKVYPNTVKWAFYDVEIWSLIYVGRNITTLEDIKYVVGATGIYCMQPYTISFTGIRDLDNIKKIRLGWCNIITEGESKVIFPEAVTDLELNTNKLKVNGESYKASDVDWSQLPNLTRLVIDGTEVTDIETYKIEN